MAKQRGLRFESLPALPCGANEDGHLIIFGKQSSGAAHGKSWSNRLRSALFPMSLKSRNHPHRCPDDTGQGGILIQATAPVLGLS